VRGGGNDGSALIPAVSVLAVLTVLTTMGLVAAGADLALSSRMSRERQAFYAAESALAAALDAWEAAGPARVPPPACFAPWPALVAAPEHVREGAWEITRAISSLPDTANADGDDGTPVVLFDRSFGYDGSPLETGGYPVFQVRISAVSGESRQAVVAEVAPITCAPVIEAAWTAGGALTLEGPIAVSGWGHTAGGVADAGAAAVPGVISRGPVATASGAVVDGRLGEGGAAFQTVAELPVPEDEVRALHAGSSLPRPENLPAPAGEGGIAGIAWSRGPYAGRLDGAGILLVHNPRFRPRAFEASRRAAEEGVITADYDPAYTHLDPANQPATLEIVRGGAFSGVVIADAIGACYQPLTVTGAVVTLTRSPLRVSALMPLQVRYSAEAVRQGGRGPIRHVTAFRPLPATAERAP
jgi:hypothetical protein